MIDKPLSCHSLTETKCRNQTVSSLIFDTVIGIFSRKFCPKSDSYLDSR